MSNQIILIYIIIIYVSLPGYFVKAEEPIWKALIPIYNIYELYRILKFEPGHIVMLLGLIVIPYTRIFTLTFLFVCTPTLIAKAYNKNFIFGIVGILFPYIIYPVMSYLPRTYIYDVEEDV